MDYRPCAVCKHHYANPGRDLCQNCFQDWASRGRNFCARCKTPKEVNQFDLCTRCYTIWKLEVEEFTIQSEVELVNKINEENVSKLGDVGRCLLQKKMSYVPTGNFRSLYEEYKDLCGVFTGSGANNAGAGREISDPIGDTIYRTPLWLDVPPDQMGSNECPLCLTQLRQGHPVRLTRCSHCFHEACARRILNGGTSITCPMCSVVTGLVTGNQPPGVMEVLFVPTQSVSGAPIGEGTIYVTYIIPSGIQGPEHKSPGAHFEGTSRACVFPDTPEGRSIVRLIKIAFRRRLVLTIGQSVSRGKDNVIVWNKISHKTRLDGGEQNFGYPDPGYLGKVRSELAALGINE